MTQHSTKAAGIDTGKHKLEAALVGSREGLEVSNDRSGHDELLGWLRRHGVERVGIESSGGYEGAAVAHLRNHGLRVMVSHPSQIRAYALSRLQRAKNDKIDAALIAAFTADVATVRDAPDSRFPAFAEHLTLIEQIEEDIARAKTRRESFREPRLRDQLEAEIKRLKSWRSAELKRLALDLREHADFAERLDLIESVPGIGNRTAIALLVRMPELGRLSREEAASLAGLAPFDNDSGQYHGRRRIAGGRKRLRTSLYAAALPAAFRWNAALISLYRRLIAAGKPHKVALVACARKLLIFANTVVARGTPWIKSTCAP